MGDVNKRKCFCVENTGEILNLNGGDLVEITQVLGFFFFFFLNQFLTSVFCWQSVLIGWLCRELYF